jgi:L-2-hydroxyglutarate oxidase LhgO
VRTHLVKLAGALMEDVHPRHYRRWGKPGIRAQLLDTRQKKLEMDFIFQHDDRSMHVLNAVSPGFTCAIPFAHHLCGHIH